MEENNKNLEENKELEKKKLSDTTVRIYLTLVKVMVNHAIKMGYAHYAVHPFAACKLPAARIRELDLTIEELIISNLP